MATGNHFWLDVAGGILVAGVAAAVIYHPFIGGRKPAPTG
jgi:membrane-associated phospholipid phosphatase